MNKDFVRRMTHEALIILGVLAFFTFMFRLWPLLVLVIFCIILGAVRLLFLKARSTTEPQAAQVKEETQKPPTEKDVRDLAYSVILTRISELVSSEFPGANWVWGKPNARKMIENGEEVYILLNGAGGYRRAIVKITNLQVIGLEYVTAQTPEAPKEEDAEDEEDDVSEPIPVNYELLAYQWAEANIMDINGRCNEAVGQGKTEVMLMAEELPAKESWESICTELRRASLENVEIAPDGIKIILTQ